MTEQNLDALDRRIINFLQGGFPLCDHPYAKVAGALGMETEDLLGRLKRMLAEGTLSRFGPLYNAERLGGAVTLAALVVPEGRFDSVTEIVNAFSEVAHNYRRRHRYNMWFVVASDSTERIDEVLREIETQTGLAVMNLPKEEEFFLELKLTA